mmetsp:Transcript_12188/g.29768  ORF Transcript_12188/g.29768 Transcript_12188/m.29768 type:complete len:139 (+) Transcript_12188:2207-2623(+)
MPCVVNHHEWITGVADLPTTFAEWKRAMFAVTEWIRTWAVVLKVSVANQWIGREDSLGGDVRRASDAIARGNMALYTLYLIYSSLSIEDSCGLGSASPGTIFSGQYFHFYCNQDSRKHIAYVFLPSSLSFRDRSFDEN